ncbi:WbuC family cupin fold metalloprotein [Catenovulum maritimum]|nr:WbuC family cupin fold metalloprotein [Catenovulum maritimum]
MKLFNSDFFKPLIAQSQDSARRRSNTNLHQGPNDAVQRLFIAMEPDSYVRPHKHKEANKWEFFFVVKGSLLFITYTPEGIVTDKVILTAGGENQGLEIPPNVWHSTVALESETVFFEVKEGPYIATDDKGFAAWSPAEGDASVAGYINKLKTVEIGESACL